MQGFPRFVLVFALTGVASGCATDWQSRGHMPRTTQTVLRLTSQPDAQVLIDGAIVGRTPLSIPLTYRGFVERYERRVTYWETQPGLSVFLSILSLGFYVPFSLIPVDHVERFEPTNTFEENEFALRLEQGGYQPWEETVRLDGEKELSLAAELVPLFQ